VGLFRRGKQEGEQRLSRIERFRQWREAQRVRRYEGEQRKLEREAKMLPLLRRQAQAEEMRTRVARAKMQRRKFKGGMGIGSTLGAIGSKAEQASGMMLGGFGPQEKRPKQAYSGNPFAATTNVLAPPKPTQKKKRQGKTIVMKVE